jgi:hypothetical protein
MKQEARNLILALGLMCDKIKRVLGPVFYTSKVTTSLLANSMPTLSL